MKASKVILGIILTVNILGIGARQLGIQKAQAAAAFEELQNREEYLRLVFPKLIREVQVRLNLVNVPGNIKSDLKEYDPRYRRIIEAAGQEADENLAEYPREIGFSHMFWAEKKRILNQKYGINWKTPPEMNPEVIFD